MIKPILACKNPYMAAKEFQSVGWHIDFSQPPDSGDPLVGISLLDNVILLGITEGYVAKENVPYIGCGIELYAEVPESEIEQIYCRHKKFVVDELAAQPWGALAFKVSICGFRIMIAA